MTDRPQAVFKLPPDLQSVTIADSDEQGREYQLVVEANDPGPFEQSFIDTHYYQPTARLLTKLLAGKGTLIDLGANIGTVSLPVALAGSRVIAVELLPRNVAKLRAAASLNGLSHFRVIEAAVTSSDGPVGFSGAEAWGHVSAPGAGTQTSGLRLDTILDRVRAEEPDFLQAPIMMKVDVEGHELNALRGAEKFLRTYRPIMIFESIESAAEPPGDAHKVKQFVTDLGYRMYVINGYILSEQQVGEPQIGVVSDILALPKEVSIWDTALASSYAIRPLSFGEQADLLANIATHSPSHLAHAKAITSLFEQTLLNNTQALFRLRSILGLAAGVFPALGGLGRIYDAMSTVVGRVDLDEGMRVFTSDGSTPGCLAYGPYCPCPAGAYEATFLIKPALVDMPADTAVAILDTTEDGANGQSRACSYGELTPGVFSPIRFRFNLDGDVRQLETRIALTVPLEMAVAAAVAIARVDAA